MRREKSIHENQLRSSDLVCEIPPFLRFSKLETAAKQLIRFAWLAVCVAALVHAQRVYQGSSHWQLEEWLAVEMAILAFPVSVPTVLVLIVAAAGLQFFGFVLPAFSRGQMTATWLLFVIAGYIQWFVFLPKLVRRWREK